MPNPETRQFIERMGLAIERMGLSRTFGRLFGLLMVADRPLSLDEMVERLHVSKASVSTNARSCEELGLARRVIFNKVKAGIGNSCNHCFALCASLFSVR